MNEKQDITANEVSEGDGITAGKTLVPSTHDRIGTEISNKALSLLKQAVKEEIHSHHQQIGEVKTDLEIKSKMNHRAREIIVEHSMKMIKEYDELLRNLDKKE